MTAATERPILVVIPVLGRPAAAQVVIGSLELADESELCRPVFVCSPDDDRQITACRATGADTVVVTRPPGPGDFAYKLNTVFADTVEPFVFQAADDVEFRPGFAEAALYQIDRDGGYGVCGTLDGANPAVKRGVHSTHSLIRRAYAEECGASWDGPGSLFSESYSHQYVDTELVELARVRGCFTFARDSVVLHHHPMYEPRVTAWDTTYRRGQADAAADRALFQRRRAEWLRMLEAA